MNNRDDVLEYFGARDAELALYDAFESAVLERWPDTRITVHRTQVSFYNRYLFAVASLPYRRMNGWPEHCLVITFGVTDQLTSPRIAVATEPYPRRWTHHVVVSRPEEIDDELMGWVGQAWTFSMEK
ncbi:hypothetical protein SAMN06295981_0635 [Corynebacterium pollutisoli]|uniref:DUF5655 domain-containing protein n=1 Tax=Corynebacterium pollutisoli TaxID=1610489 RepID=A0A1X7IBP8_9CORY|nr:DUF5655 domain-containing protein [Corynebacterium pollutisoli]SMG12073.1 hypothetical protein SAMN06295981_0635 [Corynebacterium pollutisoli]